MTTTAPVVEPQVEPLFYNGRTKCFDPEQFRRAMVVRGLTIDDLVHQVKLITGRKLARNTVIRCRAGQPVTDSTAIAVYKTLDAITPMKVA